MNDTPSANPTQDAVRGEAPRVSVVIPAYNCERFIRDAVDSALAQDYPALKIIVIDDGSTDDTGALLASYGTRIRLLSQPNRGCAAARNKGVAHAHGRYIAFLDGDDAWSPWKNTNYEYLVINRALAAWGPGSAPEPGAMRARLARSMFNHGYSHYKGGNARTAALSFLQCMKHGDIRAKSLLLFL